MHRSKQFIVASAVLLGLSVTAFAQNEPRDRGRSNPVKAATEALSLTEEQVDQIGELRRERPPRGQNGEELRTWFEERRAKVQAVLTEDQKKKIAELEAARDTMQALAGAAMLGLTEVPLGNRGFAQGRGRNPRGGRNFDTRGRRAQFSGRNRRDSRRGPDRKRRRGR